MEKYDLNKDETLLLIIDVQNKLMPAMKHRESVIKNTNVLIKAAKALDIPIVVAEQYSKGLGDTIEELRENLGEDVIMFDKIAFSACLDGLADVVEKTGKKKIVVSGLETHICVFQTVRDLLRHGYQVFLAQDAVSSRTEENYLSGLSLMKEMGTVIMSTEGIVFDLLKRSGTAEFKDISKLIK